MKQKKKQTENHTGQASSQTTESLQRTQRSHKEKLQANSTLQKKDRHNEGGNTKRKRKNRKEKRKKHNH